MSLRFTGRIDTALAEAVLRAAAERGLDAALEHILAASTAVAPIEEATLIRSAQASREGLQGVVSYDTVYAARQHEELTWRHDAGRQAKYLEQPLAAEAPVAMELIAREIRDATS